MEFRQARVDRHGRFVIPAEYRRALGLKGGDPVVLRLGEGVLHIHPKVAVIRRAQALVTKHTAGKRSLVDELLATRRAEAPKR